MSKPATMVVTDWERVGNSISFKCGGCERRRLLYVGLFDRNGETKQASACRDRECPSRARIKLSGWNPDAKDRKAAKRSESA